MKKLSETIKKLLLFLLGMSIIQFGVALFLRMNIGSDPFTVFTQGLANTLNNLGMNVTTGTANRIILVVLFSIILLLNKNHIKIGTIICVIGVGPIIDLGVRVVSVLPVESYSYLLKMFLIALVCFIIAIGFSILSATKVGVAPNDIIPFIIKERINCEYRWIRICMDAFLLIGGFMLGGTVGVGTIIAMATTGPFIQLCLPYGQKFTDFILINKDESQEELSMNTF
ncbi:MAG: YczE/YyaS/YitT family protein [Romboutsia timonensis]|jgi:putative membrane protein|uniref:YczE/YyaS/YitT family protein n=1 Tax=Romboutsia timonensis TaxID=1776391 RepID=UPI003994411D